MDGHHYYMAMESLQTRGGGVENPRVPWGSLRDSLGPS